MSQRITLAQTQLQLATSNPQIHNLYSDEALKKRKKPMEKEGEELKSGEPFMEEELEEEERALEEEIEDIEKLEDEASELEGKPVRELCGDIIELKSALKESHDKLLRAHAELENIRRRSVLDVEKAHKYGLEKFVAELLPVMDSLEHALENAKKSELRS